MLNWLARYAPAMAALESAGELGSILDVGCGRHGLACVRPEQPFVGLEIAFTGPPVATMVAFEAEPGPLPFADDAFDTVLCLDALEHVPPGDRAGFVAELARVTAGRLLLACPSTASRALDDRMRRDYAARGAPEPSWLVEHFEHGLPTAEEVESLVRAQAGFDVKPVPMVNGLLNELIVHADMDPDFAARAAAEMRERAAEWTRLLAAATLGESFRVAWLLERAPVRAARVRPDDLRGSALAALRGPAHLVGEEAAVTLPELDTAAERRLWLAPEWRRPETWLGALSAYLRAAPADGSTCLCLDATHPAYPAELVTALVSLACERLAGDEPFGDVLIVDGPVRRGAAVDVRDGAEVRAALGAPAAQPPREPAQVIATARWAKELADELRAVADRDGFERAESPFDEAEPLVTVRIPTWNGLPGLLGRALPSVLGGTYTNVEVLVASDGPDPAARAAIEALAREDPRVRYLELPERPAYPVHRLMFWMTTGLRPANLALDQARGAFVAPLDHDDAFTADHVERLVAAARREEADLVHAQGLAEPAGSPPVVIGSAPLARGQVLHGAVLYSRRLAGMRYDPHCWLLFEPGDWNMWRRMAATGARTAFEPAVVVHHAREGTVLGSQAPRRPADEELAADILGTDARELLDVIPLHACAPTS